MKKILLFVCELLALVLLPVAESQVFVQSNQFQVTVSSGLVAAIGPGKVNNNGTIISYSGGTLTLPASSTVYVYLDHTASYAPQKNTTAFISQDLPLAVVATSGTAITTITDVRTWAQVGLGGGVGGTISLTGPVTGTQSGSTIATTLTPTVTAGTCGDATHVSQTTYNAAGQITGCTPVLISGGGGSTLGYTPTIVSGLTVNISAGSVNCAGTIETFAGGNLTVIGSTTNYIYLNTAYYCGVAQKTTPFTAADIPIATVVAGSSTITTLTVQNTPFQQNGVICTGVCSQNYVPVLNTSVAPNTMKSSALVDSGGVLTYNGAFIFVNGTNSNEGFYISDGGVTEASFAMGYGPSLQNANGYGLSIPTQSGKGGASVAQDSFYCWSGNNGVPGAGVNLCIWDNYTVSTFAPQMVVGDNGITDSSGSIKTAAVIPGIIYSASGTALPTCASGIKGADAKVSDATSPTYMGAYTSGGTITAAVICSFNSSTSTYAWLTH